MASQLFIMVQRPKGGALGLSLNMRNRIAAVEKNSPAAKAGLRALDRVLSVGDKDTNGMQLADLIDDNTTMLTFIVERPPKCQHKKIVAEDNAWVAMQSMCPEELKPQTRRRTSTIIESVRELEVPEDEPEPPAEKKRVSPRKVAFEEP